MGGIFFGFGKLRFWSGSPIIDLKQKKRAHYGRQYDYNHTPRSDIFPGIFDRLTAGKKTS